MPAACKHKAGTIQRRCEQGESLGHEKRGQGVNPARVILTTEVRLRALVESRIPGNRYVRFGGDETKTCYLNIVRRREIILRIEEANSQVRSYFEPGTNLMYAIGAVLGLVGAVKVFQKWNAGDQDTGKVAAAWFGSCIFLVVVATVLQSFFGL